MGGVCSGGSGGGGKGVKGFSRKLRGKNGIAKRKEDPCSCSNDDVFHRIPFRSESENIPLQLSCQLKSSTPARPVTSRVPQMGLLIGRAGAVGLDRAVEVLDALGSSMSNFSTTTGFVSTINSKENKISILSFEVANTIAKGSNLLNSLSRDSIKHLRKDVLRSQGVQNLVSTNTTLLLQIAAADKREEYEVFSREVVRFGDLCKDPEWHNLGRLFSKLVADATSPKQPRQSVEVLMQELMSLAQHTSDLYHELQALDKFEHDYHRKVVELDSLHLPRKGQDFMIIHSDVKLQRRVVKSLKKKSLWSKKLEEVTQKLVDVVIFIHREIFDAFGRADMTNVDKVPSTGHDTLGKAGLALHYANIINQIDNIASRPSCLPPNMRDSFYHSLPICVKIALRSRLPAVNSKEELTAPQIKAEMEKTLKWLVPLAANTAKVHQGFGWVGEWANMGPEFGQKSTAAGSVGPVRLQTLYHASIERTEASILELVAWLNRLIRLLRQKEHGSNGAAQPTRSPLCRGLSRRSRYLCLPGKSGPVVAPGSRVALVRSKSLNYVAVKEERAEVLWGRVLSRSVGSSPSQSVGGKARSLSRLCSLDVMDGIDSTR